MTQEPVLRRKVLRPRPRPTPQEGRSDLVRAFPRAVVRAVSAGAGLTADVAAPSETHPSLDEVLDLIPEDGFVALLAPGGGNAACDSGTGLAVLDQALFSGLIEAMTLGRLSPRPPPSRRPTGTDSALLGAVVDQALAELAVVGMGGSTACAANGGAALGRWHMARAVSDLRLLGAMLDDCPYRMLTAAVQLAGGEGQRAGLLTLLLPVPRQQVARERAAGGARSAAPRFDGVADLRSEAPDPFQTALEGAVMGAPVQLNTVLGRVPMTLSQAMDLRVGQRLELPLTQLEEVQVIGLDGHPQALARLGQSRGMRALRIITLSDPLDSGAEMSREIGTEGAGLARIRHIAAARVSDAP